MKRFHAFLLALSILVASTAFAEEAAPQYLNIFTAHIKLGHQAEYEAAIKNLWVAMKKAGADFPVFVSQSGDSPGDYRFATLLDSMADMDAQNAVFGKAFADTPELSDQFAGHSTGNSTDIIAFRRDLGYQPENPRLGDGEAQFAYLMFLHTTPDGVPAVEEGLKAFAELNRKHGIRDGYGVTQAVSGEGPTYAIRTLAKDQGDYFTHNNMNNEKLGEEAAAIRAKVGPMLKEITYTWGFSRPDLSYQP